MYGKRCLSGKPPRQRFLYGEEQAVLHPTGMLSFFQGHFVKASTTSILCNIHIDI